MLSVTIEEEMVNLVKEVNHLENLTLEDEISYPCVKAHVQGIIVAVINLAAAFADYFTSLPS